MKTTKITIILITVAFVVNISWIYIYIDRPSWWFSEKFDCRIPENFDSLEWKIGLQQADAGKRYRLGKQLSKCGWLIDLDKEALFTVLGTPNRDLGDEALNYWLGMNHRGLIRIDSDWLSVWFDKGIVVKTEIRSD